jgi:hypothetical protein
MKNPAYFVAVFGKPGPEDKETVDSGRYPPGISGTDKSGERGDTLDWLFEISKESFRNATRGVLIDWP